MEHGNGPVYGGGGGGGMGGGGGRGGAGTGSGGTNPDLPTGGRFDP